MDYTDKIKEFSTLEALETEIRNDLVSKDVLAQRYCVRFIMLNNFDAYRKLFKFLTDDLNVATFDLEDLAYGEDKTVTIDSLIDQVQSFDRTTLITPFSELVRFYKEDDFRGFFNDVILSEDINHPQKRIYIPIIGLHNRFTDFLKNFGRIQESAPIWQYYTSQADKVTVYISKYKHFDLADNLGICQLATMREWLKFWKKQAPQEKILCGASPIRHNFIHAKPDSIFNFHTIDNAYQFITEFLSINLPIEYTPEEDSYWDTFLVSIENSPLKSFSFPKYVGQHFNRVSFSFNDILEIWADEHKNEFDRWLLKQYLLTSDLLNNKPYLAFCLKELNDYKTLNTLFMKIAERIFYIHEQGLQLQFFDERKQLMNTPIVNFANLVPKDTQDWIHKQIVDIAQRDSSLTNAKKFCTGTFDFEKPMYMEWYVLRSGQDFGDAQLQEYYPDLYAYLQQVEPLSIMPKQRWSLEYLKHYRLAKLSDEYTSDIANDIAVRNQSEESFYEWYYNFESCHNLFNKNKVDKVYWFDGMGAEFYPFIQYVIESANTEFAIINSEFAVTGLPSNTHLNSFPVDNKYVFKVSELDSIAHEEIYRKFNTLIEELDALKEQVLQILHDNKHGKRTIAFVSDHGLSALSRKCDSRKLTGDFHHEGRYDEAKNQVVSESDFIVCQNEVDNKKYRVALNHSSLGTKPTHEVHGGCTPEEVIVPYIVISNIDESKPINYNIQLRTPKVAISDGVVKVSIMPEPKNVKAIIDGVELEMQLSNLEWSIKLENQSAGKHSIQIKPFCGVGTFIDVEFYGMGFNNAAMDLADF